MAEGSLGLHGRAGDHGREPIECASPPTAPYKSAIVQEQEAKRKAAIKEAERPIDYDHYFSLAPWTPMEAACLSLGICPPSSGRPRLSNEAREELDKRLQLLTRRLGCDEDEPKVAPAEVCRILGERALVPLNEFQVRMQPAAADEDDLSADAKRSLYRMVVGMAIMNYEFDPKSAYSDSKTYTYICNDIARTNVEISARTAKKYLRAGLEYLANHDNRLKGPILRPDKARSFSWPKFH